MRKFAAIILIFCACAFAEGDFLNGKGHLGFGLLTNNETTLVLALAPRYDWAVFRVEGMGSYKAYNDEWLDIRGTLAYRFFADLPYFIETGISASYLYARAPNRFHESLNKANEHKLLWNYNEREYIDISLSVGANIYGFQANVIMPVFYLRNSVKPRPLWTFGYIFER